MAIVRGGTIAARIAGVSVPVTVVREPIVPVVIGILSAAVVVTPPTRKKFISTLVEALFAMRPTHVNVMEVMLASGWQTVSWTIANCVNISSPAPGSAVVQKLPS